jgi:hypothetical protein
MGGDVGGNVVATIKNKCNTKVATNNCIFVAKIYFVATNLVATFV